jgi:hypothetical protein
LYYYNFKNMKKVLICLCVSLSLSLVTAARGVVMRKFSLFFALLFVFFVVSCNVKKRSNVNSSVITNEAVSDSLPVFLFEGDALFDTLSEDNIIESIKYIPLSSEREAMMPKSLIIRKFSKEFLAIEFSGSPKQPKIFDLNGNYIKDAFHIGRGPNELSNLMTFTANEKSNKAYFLSFDKILSLNMNDYSMSTRTIPKPLENHVSFFWFALNNGDLVTNIVYPVEDFETNKYPFLFVYDSCFNKVKEHYYSHSRDLYQNLISGVTPPPCEAWSISSSPNGGTFIDMYSDTIYSILDGGELKPAYIISRGDKYMPTIEEVNYPADKKFKKIYYRYIVENDQYVILHYAYDNKYFVNIWNKQNGKLLCHQEVSSMLFYPIDFSIGGYHGELYVDYITSDNCIYVAIPARDLMEEIPGLKPDDNPVIVEIKLKDNYNPIKQ